jgi:hypothetical protein
MRKYYGYNKKLQQQNPTGLDLYDTEFIFKLILSIKKHDLLDLWMVLPEWWRSRVKIPIDMILNRTSVAKRKQAWLRHIIESRPDLLKQEMRKNGRYPICCEHVILPNPKMVRDEWVRFVVLDPKGLCLKPRNTTKFVNWLANFTTTSPYSKAKVDLFCDYLEHNNIDLSTHRGSEYYTTTLEETIINRTWFSEHVKSFPQPYLAAILKRQPAVVRNMAIESLLKYARAKCSSSMTHVSKLNHVIAFVRFNFPDFVE